MMKPFLSAFVMMGLLTSAAFAEGMDIFQAARTGNIAEIDRYAAAGSDLNMKDDKGSTPLIIASYNGQEAAVKELMAKGADACLVDGRGQTALMGVAFKGYVDIAKSLAARCDINTQNSVGQTALMFAALFGRQEVAKLLLEKGANPMIADVQGNTPESLAKSQGNQVMAALLAEYSEKQQASSTAKHGRDKHSY